MSASSRLAAVIAVSTALVAGTGGSAIAAPARIAVAAHPARAAQLGVTGHVAAGIVPGHRTTGYPNVACTPFNDGEEVTTLVVVLGPVPIAAFLNWICDGATRTWKRR